MKLIAFISEKVVNTLNLSLPSGTPVFIGGSNEELSTCNAERYIKKGTLKKLDTN